MQVIWKKIWQCIPDDCPCIQLHFLHWSTTIQKHLWGVKVSLSTLYISHHWSGLLVLWFLAVASTFSYFKILTGMPKAKRMIWVLFSFHMKNMSLKSFWLSVIITFPLQQPGKSFLNNIGRHAHCHAFWNRHCCGLCVWQKHHDCSFTSDVSVVVERV